MDVRRAGLRIAATGIAALIGAQANATTIIVVPPDPNPPPPPSVSYSATDLPDQNPGEDLYRYEYALHDFLVSADGTGFKVLFDPAHYTSLQAVTPPLGLEPNWSITSVEPIAGARDGYFYAGARVPYPSPPLAGFVIDFVWLGVGTPGSQPFEITGDYNRYLVASGTTTPIPEPSNGLLVIAGLLGLTTQRRRRTSRARPR
jgi:hypothetical protein